MAHTDWRKIKHALGPATRTPVQVKQLAGKDSRATEEAFDGLHDSLVVPGKWFAASAPAAALLLDALPKAGHKPSVLVLLADILGADHTRGWLSAPDHGPPEDLARTVDQRKALLLDVVAAKDASVRAAAMLPLGMLPALDESLPCLKQRATEDEDEMVRASALLGVARVGLDDRDARAIVDAAAENASPVIRGAGALASLRMRPKRSLRDASAGIAAWLSWPLPRRSDGRTEFPWFGGLQTAWYVLNQFLRGPAQGLIELARSRGEVDEAVELVLKLAKKTSDGTLARAAGEFLLEARGLSRYRERTVRSRYVAIPSELTLEQRELAKALAPTAILPQAGFGLAAAGACRRRWLGLSPPGPLDRLVSVQLDKKLIKLPLWRAWAELQARSMVGDPIPPPLEGVLSPVQRWEAMVEATAGSYGMFKGRIQAYDSARIEKEIGALMPDSGVLGTAERLADDLATRYAAAAKEGTPISPSVVMSGLLLLPLLRAGRPFEPRWDVLVPVSEEPVTREILEAIPYERREVIVWNDVRGCAPDKTEGLTEALFVLDLVPSQRIAENVVVRMKNPKVRAFLKSFDMLKAHTKRLSETAMKEPAVREALERAK